MDGREAVKKFKEDHPDLKVMRAAVYNKDLFVFEAVENPEEENYNSPYYLMDRNTGETAWFTPTVDIEAFYRAFRDNRIDTGG